VRGELVALHAERSAAGRAAGDEVQARTPESSTQSSSVPVTRSAHQGA
jgi:hypothetical protein